MCDSCPVCTMPLRFEPRANYPQQSGLAHGLLTNKNSATTKRSPLKFNPNGDVTHHIQHLHATGFIVGEIYQLHPPKPYCSAKGSLRGIYDKTEDEIIYLESEHAILFILSYGIACRMGILMLAEPRVTIPVPQCTGTPKVNIG